jgi:hypothetical protein
MAAQTKLVEKDVNVISGKGAAMFDKSVWKNGVEG